MKNKKQKQTNKQTNKNTKQNKTKQKNSFKGIAYDHAFQKFTSFHTDLQKKKKE